MRGFVLLVALLFLPVVHAQVYPPCNYDSDCESGYYCINNQCREPCQSDDDCDSPATCQPDGYCGANFIECGNGDIDPPEECDDGNNDDGDGCSANCIREKDSAFVLFDLAQVHNLFFIKVMDLLHIVKDALFQLEVKIVAIQLASNPCNEQPVIFWFPSGSGPGHNPYGKLNEIDWIIKSFIHTMEGGLSANANMWNGISSSEIDAAKDMLALADAAIAEGNFREAFECKCLALKKINNIEDTTVSCNGAEV
ncbi:MAG: hypothetical protein QW165_01010 [Candidatus Woesearchaeota archaeon]